MSNLGRKLARYLPRYLAWYVPGDGSNGPTPPTTVEHILQTDDDSDVETDDGVSVEWGA